MESAFNPADPIELKAEAATCKDLALFSLVPSILAQALILCNKNCAEKRQMSVNLPRDTHPNRNHTHRILNDTMQGAQSTFSILSKSESIKQSLSGLSLDAIT